MQSQHFLENAQNCAELAEPCGRVPAVMRWANGPLVRTMFKLRSPANVTQAI